MWNHTPSASGSDGRLAVRQNTGRFENFLQIASLGFSQKVQCYYSVTDEFQLVFSGIVCCEAC